MKVCFILGTRPEIIKCSPLIRACQLRGIPFITIHTGQHYSPELHTRFFAELDLPLPNYNLGIRSGGSHLQSEHTGRMLIDIEKILLLEKPDAVLVQGDTNTVLAGALCVRKLRTAPSYLHIRLGHVEAGLRSHDLTMTEELNRIVADQLSDYNFVPSDMAKANLELEGIVSNRIFVTGNTIVDAVEAAMPRANRSTILTELGLKPQQYFFVTAHRQENVDDPVRLRGIINGLGQLAGKYQLPVIYSLHPRTEKRLAEFAVTIPSGHRRCGTPPTGGGVRVIKPVGFFASLCLEQAARLILTDSGGIQEEASILQVPCVTLRENTERPETVSAGYNILAGTDPDRIVAAVETMLKKNVVWTPLYGDGQAAVKILDIISTEAASI